MSTIKRFIAGAVCPHCAQLDKLVMFRNDAGDTVRECVSCAYTDAIDNTGAAKELETRVNTPRPGEEALAHEDEVHIVQIIDAAPNNKTKDKNSS